MVAYIIDFTIVAILVIGITAVMGVVTNGIGIKLFSKKQKSQFVDQSNKVQIGWKQVGGGK
ncbi:MAG: hypothetical protein K0S25_1897 [Bacillus sp. (in: firmicutes)]|jgi:hypothetical protein|uniref:hypothetical protein n=1 Tax=Bacillus sp. 1NLA3E TaxID=666686 RepID=UPI000247E52C|nr:hypothetical protein [Bacillus sp. 1NLA3E]AGK52735.1 hypothetical protein B1NLA3E_04805 [Bacillus sp. 1NLA3E]MDF2904259.1 hypothetical protein [Bacillus sp. (in: firmicutes)]